MKKKIAFWGFTCFLVLVTALSVAGVAKCQSMEELTRQEAYYSRLEEEYVATLRAYLNEIGYRDSGVMLTRTVFEDGSRECSIVIHNRRFDRLSGEEKEALTEELAGMAFAAERCAFRFSLTGNA